MSAATTKLVPTVDLIAVAEHLQALYDTRFLVLDNPVQLAEIDADIAMYACNFPDAFAHSIKTCKTRQQESTALSQAASRKGGMWAAREQHMRHVALKLVKETGPLEGLVYTISETRGQEEVVFTDRTLIPERLMMIIPEQRLPDEKLIKEALKDKQVVPGAKLERADSHITIT